MPVCICEAKPGGKIRYEWSDGKGHVVVDETPIGNFGEIEGALKGHGVGG